MMQYDVTNDVSAPWTSLNAVPPGVVKHPQKLLFNPDRTTYAAQVLCLPSSAPETWGGALLCYFVVVQ